MTTSEIAVRPANDLDTFVTTTEPDTAPTTHVDLTSLVDDLLGGGLGLAGIFERMAIAEDEIDKARARHPEQRDRIWHSFRLLTPNMRLKRMETEMVFRSHCAEILDRVAAGEDTRPGTAAEVCCVLLETSMSAPLTTTGTGLYMRMWQAGRFPKIDEITEASHHYEAVRGSVIDDHERSVRRKLADADRTLGDIECHGRHHGETVDCVYAPLILEAS